MNVKNKHLSEFNNYTKKILDILNGVDMKIYLKKEIIDRIKPVLKPLKIAISII